MPYIETRSIVSHNLPSPEFDDTGFVGRKKEVRSIRQLMRTNKVIGLIGEGGVGKTALAMKVAYDLLAESEEKTGPDQPFDAIVWTTLKTRSLTASGVMELKKTISGFTMMMGAIGEALSVGKDDLIEEVIGLSSEFKVLFVLDNLETGSGEEIGQFLSRLSEKSRVLLEAIP